jgi:hypothetical protein
MRSAGPHPVPPSIHYDARRLTEVTSHPHVNMAADLGVLVNPGKPSCLHGLTSGNYH